MITLQLDQSDFMGGSLFASRWTMNGWFVAASAVILSALGTFMLLVGSQPYSHALGSALIGIVVGGVAGGAINRYFVLPRRLRSRLTERKAIHRRFTLAWSEEGLAVESENGHVRVPWGDFFRTKENENFILLYTSRTRYLILPKRCFTEPGQLASFLELLRKRVGVRPGNPANDTVTRS